jgi:tetratricopeptide (TPR) repeat protein
MDPRHQDALVQRLISNPHDQAAIAEAHAAGQQDPEAYGKLLERVGLGTPEPALASHWLNEAANVWMTTFNDPTRAVEALLQAVDRDPAGETAYSRLQELYRTSTDSEQATTLLERRAYAYATRAAEDPSLTAPAVTALKEVARRTEKSDPKRSRAALSRALGLDPSDALAIYNLREAHKAAGEFAEALPWFAAELTLESDPERRKALLFDEAEVAKRAGLVDHGFEALTRIVDEAPTDVVVKAQIASWLLESQRGGATPNATSKERASRWFVELAETYPGEHGLAYSVCALELTPGDDRAIQLAIYYAEQLQRLPEVAPLAANYVAVNPNGVMSAQARQAAGDARPTLSQPPTSVPPGLAPTAYAAAPTAYAGAPAAVGNESVDDLLERADSLARKSRKNEAIATYRQVLTLDPINADALAYLTDQLPLKRKYGELRDVLMNAAMTPAALFEDRTRWLREAADLCENQLRDLEGAVTAWKHLVEIEPDNHAAYDQLRRLLERAKRWDELASVLAHEASNTEDVEARIAIERTLARVHSEHRKDNVAAGEAWARIAGISPGDEDSLNEAVRLFEEAQRPDLAADTIAEHVARVEDPTATRDLYIKLGDLRALQGQAREGGEALAEGAAKLKDVALWARAEHYFVHAKAWEQAGNAADEQERLASEDEEKSKLLARAASYLLQMNEREEAIIRLERAVDLAPTVDEYATALEQQLIAAGRVEEVATLFLTRAERLTDPAARVVLRKRAAKVQNEHLQNVVAARASYVMVLRDAADPEALLWLANDAEERKDVDGEVAYLSRLVDAEPDVALKVTYALREARLHARGLNDVESGVQRLHYVLSNLDENSEAVMTEIADLEQSRGRHDEAAKILERRFSVTQSDEARLEVAARLADIYERRLEQPSEAIRVLSFIHGADPGDFDATQRLCRLAEENERWELVAELTSELVAVEGDAEEASRMTRRLAEVYADKLDRGDDGLRVLAEAGERGDVACRDAFVALGDRLEKPAEVARHLVAWHKTEAPSDERTQALLAAFRRFVKSGSDAEAIDVAKELGVIETASAEVGETLEPIAIRAKDLEALKLAHTLRVSELVEAARATEFVRQAEVLASVDVPATEAVAHGETGLKEIDPNSAEPLLARLAALTPDTNAKIAIYERQITRCTTPETAVPALCRAAEVALELGDTEQSGGFFQMALAENLAEESLERIHDLVRELDKRAEREGKSSLREVFAEALARGGQSARDGGKSRSRMLRRAARLAAFELRDTDRALTWIGDALCQYVEQESLGTLNDVAATVGNYELAEQVATRALEEVFDGPMVRELLRYRADLRQDQLDNLAGAAEDLRRLYDLNPGDFEVNGRLATMYEELGDYLGMVRLYEDQILRSRDQVLRGDLARTVARIWEEKLDDPRETADAWRRVLRFHPTDEDAKRGLAKAKANMLHARSSEASALPPPVVEAPPPPIVSSVPPIGYGVDSRTPEASPEVPPLPATLAGETSEEAESHSDAEASGSHADSALGDAAANDASAGADSDVSNAEPGSGDLDDDAAPVHTAPAEATAAEADEANTALHESGDSFAPVSDALASDEEEAEHASQQSLQWGSESSSEPNDADSSDVDAAAEAAYAASLPPVSLGQENQTLSLDPDDLQTVIHGESAGDEEDVDLLDAEEIEEVEELDEESELDSLLPQRASTPPARRPSDAGEAPKPPPPPSLASRKD